MSEVRSLWAAASGPQTQALPDQPSNEAIPRLRGNSFGKDRCERVSWPSRMAAQPPHGPDADSTGPGSTGADSARPGLPVRVRALRGATTVDEDSCVQVTDRTQALLNAMLARNGVEHADIISVIFTATDDVHSMFPATAARAIGFRRRPALVRPRTRHRRGAAAVHTGHDARRDHATRTAPHLPRGRPGLTR